MASTSTPHIQNFVILNKSDVKCRNILCCLDPFRASHNKYTGREWPPPPSQMEVNVPLKSRGVPPPLQKGLWSFEEQDQHFWKVLERVDSDKRNLYQCMLHPSPTLVALAWKDDELACEQTRDWHTLAHSPRAHKQAQAVTIPEGHNGPRMKADQGTQSVVFWRIMWFVLYIQLKSDVSFYITSTKTH